MPVPVSISSPQNAQLYFLTIFGRLRPIVCESLYILDYKNLSTFKIMRTIIKFRVNKLYLAKVLKVLLILLLVKILENDRNEH
jgi:hypothetical protein